MTPSCQWRWMPGGRSNLETVQLSRHYIAEISLNATLSHNQPTNQLLFLLQYQNSVGNIRCLVSEISESQGVKSIFHRSSYTTWIGIRNTYLCQPRVPAASIQDDVPGFAGLVQKHNVANMSCVKVIFVNKIWRDLISNYPRNSCVPLRCLLSSV